MDRGYLEAEELQSLPPPEILGRSLSLGSIISTRSSFGQLADKAFFCSDLRSVHEIGSGLQGVIFEQVGKVDVFKKERPGNESRPSNLAHEYDLHRAISGAFNRYRNSTKTKVKVPEQIQYPPVDHAFWDHTFSKIPLEHRIPGRAFSMERVLPLPKVTRQALIDFCLQPQAMGFETDLGLSALRILDSPQNKHCLARIYLGMESGPYNHEAPLRNFPLYLNTMKEIGLEIYDLANQMGKAYAILHWGAGVNGDDVEFVLGTTLEPHDGNLELQHRAIRIFMLDFGQCEEVDLTKPPRVVYQAFRGAMVLGDSRNFIPHVSTEPDLFSAFKAGYVEAGSDILSQRGLDDVFSIERFMQEYENYARDFLY